MPHTPADRIAVRPATMGDFAAVARLRNILQAEGRARRPDIYRPRFLDDTAAMFQALLVEPGETHWVATLNDDVAGYAWSFTGDGSGSSVTFPRRFVTIHQIIVDPRTQRRGIGRALLAAVETAALGDGVEVVTLNVDASNHAAQAFYDRVGLSSASEFRTKLLRHVHRLELE